MHSDYNSDWNHRAVVGYHSREWDALVEQGYVTMEVNDGVALMLAQRTPKFGRGPWNPHHGHP